MCVCVCVRAQEKNRYTRPLSLEGFYFNIFYVHTHNTGCCIYILHYWVSALSVCGCAHGVKDSHFTYEWTTFFFSLLLDGQTLSSIEFNFLVLLATDLGRILNTCASNSLVIWNICCQYFVFENSCLAKV